LGFKVCNFFFFFLMGAMQRDCIGIGGSWTELVE